MAWENILCIKGNETVLLILPAKAATDLRLKENERLKFEVQNGALMIKKMNDNHPAIDTVVSKGDNDYD